MRKSAVILIGALVGLTGVAPAAYARHRAPKVVVPPPRMDEKGQFYATPMQAGGIAAPGLEMVPGLGLATGVVNGVAQPVLAVPGAAPGLVIPGLDAAGGIINGVTQPLIPPAS